LLNCISELKQKKVTMESSFFQIKTFLPKIKKNEKIENTFENLLIHSECYKKNRVEKRVLFSKWIQMHR
jgi:hypothetical protein